MDDPELGARCWCQQRLSEKVGGEAASRTLDEGRRKLEASGRQGRWAGVIRGVVRVS